MQAFIDGFAKETFGKTLTETLSQNTCMFCGKSATEFRDAISRKEFLISGICQDCQDKTFV
jgi:hypothetical protein